MEITSRIKRSLLLSACMVALGTVLTVFAAAQKSVGKCDFKNGQFYIEINKDFNADQLNNFIVKYDLADLNLNLVLLTNNVDTLKKLGWKVEANNQKKLVITKKLSGSSDWNSHSDEIFYSDKMRPISQQFPAVSEAVVYGYNSFKNKYPFAVRDSTVRFFLRNFQESQKVMLAGSFNDFLPEALAMRKTDSGWIADVKLGPGKYWYKFIADGNWLVDDDNLLRENDGYGNTNSVFYKTNVSFVLDGNLNAKKVFVVGSFNNWQNKKLAMQKTAVGWMLRLYLSDGTHRYKYAVDNSFIPDVTNAERLPDDHGGFNSVIRIGKPWLFKLNGYPSAKKVILAGDFNNWNTGELEMHKTANGWELPYTLGAGNYQYKFIVDGQWMLDPANQLTAKSDDDIQNSFLIIGPNHKFKLKGFENARSVYLAGDFNNWSPTSLAMKKEGGNWVFSVHLSVGKHKYKYIVDGKWITDPDNKDWEQNEYNNGNSVLWIER